MKTKFLLALLTLNSLLFYANSAFAATASSIEGTQKIANLSQTISKSINLDSGYHSLIESAINRALLAKGEKNNANVAGGESAPAPTSTPRSIVNGKVAQPTPKPTLKPNVAGGITVPVSTTPRRPITNGKIANPSPSPSNPPVLINGIIQKVDPQPTPAASVKPIINGRMANPDRK
jgi:hypothetical protein